jgi:hypothetical protein
MMVITVAQGKFVRLTAAGAAPEWLNISVTGFPFHPPHGRGAKAPESIGLLWTANHQLTIVDKSVCSAISE